MSDIARIQIYHNRLEPSNPYPTEIESALTELKAKGLPERGWDTKNTPGVIRHETGAEIVVLVVAVLELSAAILTQLLRSSPSREASHAFEVVVADPTRSAPEALSLCPRPGETCPNALRYAESRNFLLPAQPTSTSIISC
jgi:hypothetical protein